MRLLTVSVLVCAMMALGGALVIRPEAKAESDETAKSQLVKRWSCSGGWTAFNGRCFYYIPRPMTWAKAERNCQSMGGNLASVHNVMEYHELQRLIMTGSHEYTETWIGGTDAQEENQWFWSDGTTFHYTNWCTGEPNNYGGRQHCLRINHGVQKCWDDYQCHVRKPSVCGKKMS